MKTEFGLFDTVVSGPAAAPYAVGWALLGTAFVVGIVYEQAKLSFGGKADFGQVGLRAFLAACALGSYAYLCQWIWAATQSLAFEIYPDSKMEALGKMLAEVANKFQSYSFSVVDLGAGLKDATIVLASIAAWLIALLGHWMLQDIQAVAWNVLFVFGPLLLGASVFGLPTGRIWLMGLIEVGSWSITSAVVYRSIESTLHEYLKKAATTPLMSTEFLYVLNTLTFLALMPMLVPVITGHFLGGSVVRALSGAVASSPVMAGVGSFVGSKLGISPSQVSSGKLGSSGAAPPARARRDGDV